MGWMDWKEKRVYIIVEADSGSRNYSGVVNDVVFMGKNTEKMDIYFLEIVDRFDKKIGIISSSIKVIQEEER